MNFASHSELFLSAASMSGSLLCAGLALTALVRSKRDLRAAAIQFGKTFSAILIGMGMDRGVASARRKAPELAP